MKIGLLLPKSDMYPALAMDFVQAFKLGQPNWAYDLVLENVGNAADESLLKTYEKMVIEKGVDLVFAFCGPHVLLELVKKATAFNTPLIHLDLGGNVLLNEVHSKNVVHLSLNLCQSAYQAGHHAAKNIGTKGIIASSFYDGGYHIHFSFEQGFKAAGGEEIAYYVSPHKFEEASLDPLFNLIEQGNPDFIFGLYSYKEGNHMLQALAQSEYNGKIPFLTTPIMTDESFVTDNYQLEKVQSLASWSFDDPSEAMQQFVKKCTEITGKKPNLFHLLGYESFLIIDQCLKENGTIPNEIGTYFNTKTIDTPRGTLFFNELNESQPKNMKLREFQYNQVAYHNHVVDTLDNQNTESLIPHVEGLQFSGWRNPYICT